MRILPFKSIATIHSCGWTKWALNNARGVAWQLQLRQTPGRPASGSCLISAPRSFRWLQVSRSSSKNILPSHDGKKDTPLAFIWSNRNYMYSSHLIYMVGCAYGLLTKYVVVSLLLYIYGPLWRQLSCQSKFLLQILLVHRLCSWRSL